MGKSTHLGQSTGDQINSGILATILFRILYPHPRLIFKNLNIKLSKREEDGSWRKLHNDELHSLYSSPNIVRVNK
jgi:hypothetical protein